MLSLVLVAALCDANGCTYIDATDRFPEIVDDRSCAAMANHANAYNVSQDEPARFACLEPSKYRELAEKSEI